MCGQDQHRLGQAASRSQERVEVTGLPELIERPVVRQNRIARDGRVRTGLDAAEKTRSRCRPKALRRVALSRPREGGASRRDPDVVRRHRKADVVPLRR
jgi:hypothetical protein